jgi:hypothetical protein
MPATYVLTIAGVTKQFQFQTIRITEEQNARNSAHFEVLSLPGTYRPALDAEVIITENGTRIFGGTIIAPRERGTNASAGPDRHRGRGGRFQRALADRRYVNVTIPAGTSLYTALNTYILPYLSGFGVTLSGSQVNPGPTLPELHYDYVVCSDVLDDLAKYAGNWTREINYSKVLRIYDPSTSSAPFNVSANDGNVIGDVTVEPSREKYANRATVRFNEAARQAYAFLNGEAGGSAFVDGDTVVIGSRTYTFQSTLTNVNGHIQVGASVGDSILNLTAAIVAGAGAGSAYAAATTINSQVEAYAPSPLVMICRALTGGAAGNSIGVSTTSNLIWHTEGSIPTSTLTLGSDVSLTNVVTVDDAGEQALYDVWEDVITVDTNSAATATEAGTNYLSQRTLTRKMVTYTTRRLGIQPGQTQTINLPRRNVNNSFLVSRVDTMEGRKGVLHRTVTAIEGTVVQSSWREVYKQWAAGGGTGSVISGGGTVIVEGGTPVYFLGASAIEVARSATPTWVAIGAVQVSIDTTEIGTTAGTVTVRLRAVAAGVSVTARLYNVSDNASAGAGVAVTSTSWVTDVFAVTFAAGAKIYELQVLPGTANKDVAAVGYLKVAA